MNSPKATGPANQCGKCGHNFGKQDKFCSYCGAPRGTEDTFQPRSNVSSMLYGPPYRAKYQCPNCNESFIVSGLGRPKMRYCPNCGTVCSCSSTRGF